MIAHGGGDRLPVAFQRRQQHVKEMALAGDALAAEITGNRALIKGIPDGELAHRQPGRLPDLPQLTHPGPHLRRELGIQRLQGRGRPARDLGHTAIFRDQPTAVSLPGQESVATDRNGLLQARATPGRCGFLKGMRENPGSLLTVAFQAAATASEILRASPPRAFAEKSGWDLGVELAVELAIRSRLAAETPDIGFLGGAEERAGAPGAEWAWALGPIDVTSDFARSVPLCAVSLALPHHR